MSTADETPAPDPTIIQAGELLLDALDFTRLGLPATGIRHAFRGLDPESVDLVMAALEQIEESFCREGRFQRVD